MKLYNHLTLILLCCLLTNYIFSEETLGFSDQLNQISIEHILSKPHDLDTTQKKLFKSCLKLIQNRSYVEEKKRFQKELELRDKLNEIGGFVSEVSFGLPILIWLYQRDDENSYWLHNAIFEMGSTAIPYLLKSSKSNHSKIRIKSIGSLYEVDTQQQPIYLNKLKENLLSINNQDRLTALSVIIRIDSIHLKLLPTLVELLNDIEAISNLTSKIIKINIKDNKKLLIQYISKVSPIQKARLIKILWSSLTKTETEKFTQIILNELIKCSDNEKKVLFAICIELGISLQDDAYSALRMLLKDPQFFNRNWSKILEQDIWNPVLEKLALESNILVSLNAICLLSLKGIFNEDYIIIIAKYLSSENLDIVEKCLDTIYFMIFQNVHDQVSLGNMFNQDIFFESDFTYLDILNFNILKTQLKMGNKTFEVNNFISYLSNGAILETINSIKNDIMWYLKFSDKIIWDKQSIIENSYQQLLGFKIFFPNSSNKLELKKSLTKAEIEKIKWFQVEILKQTFNGISKINPKVIYEPLLPILSTLLNKTESIALKAGFLLKLWGLDALPFLSDNLNSNDSILKLRTHGILLYFNEIYDKSSHLNFIRNSLTDANSKIREIAVDMLLLSIVPPEYNIPIIIEALALERKNSQRAAASLFFADQIAIPYLKEAINHKNPVVAVKAIGILIRNSGDVDTYLPNLVKKFDQGSHYVKISIAKALEDIGPKAVSAAKIMIPGLGGNQDLSWRCKQAIKYMGKDCVNALLQYGITNSDQKVKLISHSLLVQFGIERNKNLKPILEALSNPNNPLKSVIYAELAELKELADSAFLELFNIVKKVSGEQKVQTLYALSQVAPNNIETLELLIQSLDDQNYRVVCTACHCLGTMGAKAKKAVPKLQKLAMNSNSSIKKLAQFALKQILGI